MRRQAAHIHIFKRAAAGGVFVKISVQPGR